jgi:lipase
MTPVRPFEEHTFRGAADAVIAAAVWPGAGEPLVCVHGLTASSRSFAGLATELPDRKLVAVDCRGRGDSSKEGPFGMSAHAADLAAVMSDAGIDRATIVGHSMGTYVAAAFCAEFPSRVSRLVFIDGGYPPDLPAGVEPEQLLETTVSFVVEKLRRTWSSYDEYIAYWESLPLYSDGVDEYGRVYLTYDLTGEPPLLRSRMVADCLAPDWCDVFDKAAASKRLEAVDVPLLLLRAPGGLTGVGDVVVREPAREAIKALVPDTTDIEVPETNHATILWSSAGASSVGKAIDAFLS